ncbi:hypothetical protein P5G50_15120 [Leifsonia sp. F6_8S_P_1B]|uniref:Uncharacterized protein n=1 Tax=Leifsonia williamsii TaxID=3035919 RepID=A0ABT8KH34_9MICO|nr:hypothetical protein [Leifsonia williamsii]MDN4615782.1 hypothetical protein [Leifsonia williamsii]
MELDRLRRAGTDPDPEFLVRELVGSVTRALPDDVAGSVLVVERTRTLSDWLGRRPGAITRLRLSGEREALSLRQEPGGRWIAEVEECYAGVVLSNHSITFGRWLTAFAELVDDLAVRAAEDSADAARALQKLGILPPGSEVHVDGADPARDLLTLAARLGRRVPGEAVAAVGRIGALLAETLARVAGSGEPDATVRLAATVYLPDTLRAYLALPPEWAAEHVLAGGLTPAQALLAQLDALESAAQSMRDAAVEQDASALLVNGRLLAERFAGPRLELDLP